jgi:hypothetical protein
VRSYPSCGSSADTVLRRHYSGYELPDCWSSRIHAIWELSTLTAAWPVLCLRRRVGMHRTRTATAGNRSRLTV